MKEFSRIIPAACAAMLLQAVTLPAAAEQQQFSLSKLGTSEAVSGQIEWPSGKLANWNGPVVIITPGLSAQDRDGWTLFALATPMPEWSPFKDLSEALVRKGFAVVRFDAPAVMPPSMKCRETIRRQGLDEAVVTSQCLKMDILLRATIDTHFSGIERVAAHVQSLTPGARRKLILAALGQDVHLAAQVADRGHITVHGLATIGGAASSFLDNARWQMVDRAIATLPLFDNNNDGKVSDEEIRNGHASGIGNFMKLAGWQHPNGASWENENKEELRARLTNDFQSAHQNSCSGIQSGCIYTQHVHGVAIPAVSGATLHYLRHSKATVDIMAARRIPILFLWGDKSASFAVAEQAKLAIDAARNGANTCVVRYAQRFQFLSASSDDEWMQKETLDDVAERMREFASQRIAGVTERSAASGTHISSLK